MIARAPGILVAVCLVGLFPLADSAGAVAGLRTGLLDPSRLLGSGGNDRMNAGSDRVSGGAGNDRLNGGAGRDILSGGPGTNVPVQ